MSAKTVVAKGVAWASKKSPALLALFACGGVIATGFLTYKATKKAEKHIWEEKVKRASEHNETHDEPIDPEDVKLEAKETIKIVWKDWLPVGIMATSTVAAIVGSYRINVKRSLALAAGLAAAEKTANELMDEKKLSETLGKTKAGELLGNMKSKNVQKAAEAINGPDSIPYSSYAGNTIFYDELTGQIFKSDRQSIEKALLDCSKFLRSDLSCDANTFYEEMGLQTPDAGRYHGWTFEETGDVIEPKFTVCEVKWQNQKYPVWSLDLNLDEGFFRQFFNLGSSGYGKYIPASVLR